MSFSIRLTQSEKSLAESYARLHSISLAEAFRRALFEKIEDEKIVVTPLRVGHRRDVHNR